MGKLEQLVEDRINNLKSTLALFKANLHKIGEGRDFYEKLIKDYEAEIAAWELERGRILPERSEEGVLEKMIAEKLTELARTRDKLWYEISDASGDIYKRSLRRHLVTRRDIYKRSLRRHLVARRQQQILEIEDQIKKLEAERRRILPEGTWILPLTPPF